MRVAICGVRGSTPSPGPEFVRYGGHTSCVAVAHDGDVPTLVLDAGTGVRRLTSLLEGAPFRGTLLLTHLHWDHVQGLPFGPSLDRPDAAVDLWLPEQGDEDAEAVLARIMSPPLFPIEPWQLRGSWSFRSLAPGVHSFSGFTVTAVEIPHKGGRTFGYRVSDGRSTLAYLPDHWPVALGPGPDGWGELHAAALALVSGVDLLLHDGQYTAEEFSAGGRSSFGHSTMEYAADLAALAGAELVLFHHDPARTDDELDRLAARLGVRAAAEGDVYEL